MSTHDCPVTYLAHGACTHCGASNRLDLPVGIPIKQAPSALIEADFWQELRSKVRKGRLTVRLPQEPITLLHDLDVLWLPFMYLQGKTEGPLCLRADGQPKQKRHEEIEVSLELDGIQKFSGIQPLISQLD